MIRVVENLPRADPWHRSSDHRHLRCLQSRSPRKGLRAEPAQEAPYPGYPPEGVERIPTDWDLVRLGSVAKLESGHTPSRRRPEYWGGPHPWLSLADSAELRNLTVRQTVETITDDGLANSSARILPVGTVVLSRTGQHDLCS